MAADSETAPPVLVVWAQIPEVDQALARLSQTDQVTVCRIADPDGLASAIAQERPALVIAELGAPKGAHSALKKLLGTTEHAGVRTVWVSAAADTKADRKRANQTPRSRLVAGPEFLAPRLVEALRECLGLERRRHFRREVQFPGSLWRAPDEERPMTVMVENLSESGARVTSTEEMPLGTELQVSLKLEDTPLRTSTQVIRCSRDKEEGLWHLGLFFRELTDEQLEGVRRVVHAGEAP